MGVELWLVRHGETAWSLSGAHTSRTDIPLTRAQETCRIAGFGSQMLVTHNLHEWDYGESEGKTTKEMREKYHDPDWSVWTREIVGGERVEQVGDRADKVIAQALEGAPDSSRVALFAHAHILRILAARWIGLEARGGQHFGLGTGSVSVLGWERETRVIDHWNRGFED
jgi:broad specificity phosphatase PhoE